MKILMVCLGNICRSPIAEGVLKDKLKKAGVDYTVDSAGTGGWHAGESPDQRAIAIAAQNQISISAQKARKVRSDDFKDFDLILGMDKSVYQDLKAMVDKNNGPKIHLFLDYAGFGFEDVPDPWYGNQEDFRMVFELIDKACIAITTKLLNINT